MRKLFALVACAGLLVACSSSGGGGESSPSLSPSAAATTRPAKEITYTSGTADVALSGGSQVAFAAPLDTGDFTPDDGFDVWWRSGDTALNVSGDLTSGEVDAFVRIETGPTDAEAFIDPFHTECDVTLTAYSDTELAGTFTCAELPAFAGKATAGATGTFSATA